MVSTEPGSCENCWMVSTEPESYENCWSFEPAKESLTDWKAESWISTGLSASCWTPNGP
ncbi:MAG: hypothetical protein VCD16_12610 [Planctomycetota bacterium]